ncbi:MAG: DUF4011 domain-containing protein [Promethearchaeota archaeon]
MQVDHGDRARAKIKFWKSSFLDLSYRNDQLNFKPSASDVLEIINPDATSLFKILLVMQQTFTFPPVYIPSKRKSKTVGDIPPLNKKNIPEDVVKKLTPQHIKALNKISKDIRLTQMLTYEDDNIVKKKIQRLLDKTTEMLEERGINILYLTIGLLNWYDEKEKKQLSSPLMFIPVRLLSKPLECELLDDEVIINPSLREKMRAYRIQLPSFPNRFSEFNTNTFVRYFEDVQEKIAFQENWTVEKRMFISTFGFSKLNLFEDMDDHEALLLEHPIVKAIAEESGFKENPANLPNLTQLNDDQNPKHHHTLLDCDSSQMEAILYAKSGCSLIIQGPPGTGKSQCITNIIGECLAEGKKVLFVAQKKAALDVVKRRLDQCGIGQFCLQVHSQNANKKDIVTSIDEALNRNLSLPHVKEGKFQDLIHTRTKLNEYVELINQPFGKLERSLYQIIGKMLKFQKIPKITTSFRDPNEVSLEDYTSLKYIFGELDQFRTTIENYSQNPWCVAKITNQLILSNELKVILRKSLTAFRNGNSQLQEGLRNFHLKFPPQFENQPNIITDWQKQSIITKYWVSAVRYLWEPWQIMEDAYQEISEYFEIESMINYTDINFDSFRQIRHVYNSQAPTNTKLFNFLLQKLRKFLERLQNFQNHMAAFNLKSNFIPIQTVMNFQEFKAFTDKYTPEAFLLEVDLLMSRFTTDYLAWNKRFSAIYKEDKNKILSCRQISKKKANPMGHLNQIKTFQDKFGKPYHVKKSYFHDVVSDFQELYQEWEEYQELEQEILPFLNVSFLPHQFEQSLWDQNHIFAQQWLDNLPYLNDWFEVQVRAHHIADLGFKELFDALLDKQYYIPEDKTPISYELIFLHSFYAMWVEILTDSLPPIANFDKIFHEKYLKKFRQRDVETMEMNKLRLKHFLASLKPQSDLDLSPELLEQIGFVRREAKKKRNIKPLRQVFSKIRDLLTQIMPCFLMSPLSIANYLDINQFNQHFDVVVFDEASQVTPEDAVGAIVRGKSLVVVGDSEQLPPTRFFTSKKISDIMDMSLDTEIQTMDSLLDECTGIGFREKLLKFHYRSRKEGLIAFSNQRFYNGRLFSFPDISRETSTAVTVNAQENYSQINNLPAIQFIHVPNGIKIKGRNPIEAGKIAEAIIQHYKSNISASTEYSLGVVAFSMVQQEEIRSALQKLLKTAPGVEKYMNSIQSEPLFIKNLENVQGDERDFIFFSIGYTKDATGKMSLNFGPLNRSGGYRRLNVAITRARYHVKLFASFLPSDIQMDRVKARGLRELIQYMKYARTHTLPQSQTQKQTKNDPNQGELMLDPDSLEADIRETLESEGYTVVPKVGVSTIRIDLAVVHPKDASRYILGIECDGGSYKTAVNARDRDRIRFNVLTGLGWNIYHIWTPDWLTHKSKIVKHIKRRITTLIQKDTQLALD